MDELEFKINIVSDADNSGFKAAATAASDLATTTAKTSGAAGDLAKEMGVINVTQEDVEKATKKTTVAFKASDGEIRKVGNQLGQLAGLGNVGSLALGGVSAAALGAAQSVKLLIDTWNEVQSTINGPIEIGLPENTPNHISAAATAWQQYAEARAAVIAATQGAEASASAQEKKLANELKLIKEVLAAQKEKALADLELNKGTMTPEAYAATRANLGNIFGAAGTAAEQNNRRALIANKATEAANLEIQAREKTQQALAIKAAPAPVAANFQKTLDENAANAETAKKELKERIALIDRFQKYKAGGSVPEYEGLDGALLMLGESAKFTKRYGYWNDPVKAADAARKIETTPLTQAEVAIDTASSYRSRQETNSAEKKRLMQEAGADSGKAENFRGEVQTDSAFESRQNRVDAQVSQLHQASAGRMTGASQQTVTAVKDFTAATVGGFAEIRTQLASSQRELNQLRQQLRRVPHNNF